MLIQSSFFFFFAIMIWDIFYRLPLVHGLMVVKLGGPKLTVKSFAYNPNDEGTRNLLVEGDNTIIVKEFL